MTVTWKYAHTEDDLCVLKSSKLLLVGRVFHNGTDYDYEVMSVAMYHLALNGYKYETLHSGSGSYQYCRECVESRLVG